MTGAERQAAYLKRQKDRATKMRAALAEIVELLPNPAGETGKRIRQIAEEALKC